MVACSTQGPNDPQVFLKLADLGQSKNNKDKAKAKEKGYLQEKLGPPASELTVAGPHRGAGRIRPILPMADSPLSDRWESA